MNGLDTRGIGDGFMQGFAFVDSYMNNQDAKARQNKLDAERQEDRQYNRERTERLDQQNTETLEFNRKLATEQNERAKGADERAQSSDARAQATHDEAIRLRRGQEGWATWMAKGEFTPEQEEFFKANPDINPLKFMDPKVRSGVEFFQTLTDTDDIDSDEKLFQAVNSPQGLKAFNDVYGRQINKGDGGRKRVVGILPGPKEGTVVLELEVMDEKGNVRRAPMTEQRSTDDIVKQVPLETIVEQLAGMSQLTSLVGNMSEENRKRAIEYGMRAGFLKELDEGETAKDRYVVVGGQLWDAKAGKYIERPDSAAETQKLAEKIATAQFEAQSEFSQDKVPYEKYFNDALEMLGSAKTSAQEEPEPPAPGAPSGGGTKDDPYQADSQEHINWFKASAPKGAVITINGKLYTK